MRKPLFLNKNLLKITDTEELEEKLKNSKILYLATNIILLFYISVSIAYLIAVSSNSYDYQKQLGNSYEQNMLRDIEISKIVLNDLKEGKYKIDYENLSLNINNGENIDFSYILDETLIKYLLLNEDGKKFLNEYVLKDIINNQESKISSINQSIKDMQKRYLDIGKERFIYSFKNGLFIVLIPFLLLGVLLIYFKERELFIELKLKRNP